MPEMGIADITRGLDPVHAVTVVQVIGDHARYHGLGKTGPAGMAFKLARGIEEYRAATETLIPSWLKQLAHLRTMGSLGPIQTCNAELLVGEQFAPLGIRLLDTAWRRGIAVDGPALHIAPIVGLGRGGIACWVTGCPGMVIVLRHTVLRLDVQVICLECQYHLYDRVIAFAPLS